MMFSMKMICSRFTAEWLENNGYLWYSFFTAYADNDNSKKKLKTDIRMYSRLFTKDLRVQRALKIPSPRG